MNVQIEYLVLFIAFGFIVTYLLVPLAKRLAFAHGFVSYPGGRKIHDGAIPVLGGPAIFAPQIILFLVYVYLLITDSSSIAHDRIPKFLSLFVGTTWILVLGSIDDWIKLGWRKKLLGQLLGISILLVGGNTIGKIVVPFYGLADLGLFGYLLFGFIVLVITNAVNLIDGMDGLAAGICLFAAITCGILGFNRGYMFVTAICFTTVGSLLAFLRFNFPPASIFMGDSGSLALGFMLSALATSDIVTGSSQRYTSLTTFVALLLPFAIALLDVALSVARRWISGRRIFLPDAGHIHHRFMEMFQRRRLVVGIFYIFSALFCTVTLLISFNPESYFPLIIAGLVVGVLVAVMAVVLRINRIDRITTSIKNRCDCQFLSTFNTYMEGRLRRVKSHDELVALLEVGVRDLDFDTVEVSSNGCKPYIWKNNRDPHPDSPKRNGARVFNYSELSVKWVVPTHDDPSYQKYLELVWWRFLASRGEASGIEWRDKCHQP